MTGMGDLSHPPFNILDFATHFDVEPLSISLCLQWTKRLSGISCPYHLCCILYHPHSRRYISPGSASYRFLPIMLTGVVRVVHCERGPPRDPVVVNARIVESLSQKSNQKLIVYFRLLA